MSEAKVKTNTIRIFISYAHEDENHWHQIENQIKTLPNFDTIVHWYDRKIAPGADWNEEIAEELNKAHIILLLLSADFLSSTYVRSTELPMALKRNQFEGVEVVPIVLRPVTAWGDDDRLKRLQALPKDSIPVIEWPSRDHAYSDIGRGIGELIKKISERSLSTSSTETEGASSHGTTSSVAKVQPLGDEPTEVRPLLDRRQTQMSSRNKQAVLVAAFLGGIVSSLLIWYWAVPPLWTFKPANAVEYNIRGEVRLKALDDIEGALADFQEAVRREPKSPRFLHNLGQAHLVKGEYGVAISMFQEAIIRNKTFLEAHNDLCVAYASQKNFQESLKILDQAKDIVADHPWTLKNQGFILYMQGDYKAAVLMYTEAIHKDPNYFEAYLYRGWAHSRLNRPLEANGDHYHAVSGDRSLSRRVDPKTWD